MVSINFRTLSSFIVDDNVGDLREYLQQDRVDIDDRDDNGSTALLLAASKGKSGLVRELLKYGADPNAEDTDNWTALLCAAKEDYTSICVDLLNHGANADHKDMAGWSSLLWACYKGHVNTARLLIEKHADVNVHGQYYLTPLMLASGRGHTATARLLLDSGARVNTGDKYGTTALIWACRKSHVEIVDMLLEAGANVDVSGMYCWTPLLVATRENCADIVQKLLEKKPNVNAVDNNGCTALTIASKEGHYDICTALLNAGAYVNLHDRGGDTNLIHAAKAGHKSIIEVLLKKYADVDMTGKERKTALYWAVEKNHVSVVKALLHANPNLETANKEGDTALLRAVRNRNLEIVQLLLDKKARVTAVDRVGDTVLHIAMRARSKAIVEVLLRNPKHSQVLYRPNHNGETPYNIDISHQKTILEQIFGARRLNTNEDNEKMLGYELYSSALADMLSEPSLTMPITVGLFAKWGSGKSFLLDKLRDEMKGFTRQWLEPELKLSAILLVLVVYASVIVSIIFGVALHSWIIAIAVGGGVLLSFVTGLYIVYWGTRRYSWSWAHSFGLVLAQKIDALKLILQVTFCTPPGHKWIMSNNTHQIHPIRFHFTDQAKVSRSATGENSVVKMLGSLLDSIESDYGIFATRLYRAFRPRPMRSASPWRFRRFCCVPYFVIFLICVNFLLALLTILFLYCVGKVDNQIWYSKIFKFGFIAIGVVLSVAIVANLYTWSRIVLSLIVSQRKKLQMNVSRLHSLRAEGYLQTLKREVDILVDMVQCLDAFSGRQTRLVMVIDGLDSCEQDQVLYVLDAVQLLFTEQATPFITVLAIDPHIISKVIKLNLNRIFNESNIGGHDYLHNLVHLPFHLQNSGLRKVKTAQEAALVLKRRDPSIGHDNQAHVLSWLERDESNQHNQNDRIKRNVVWGSSIESSNVKNRPEHQNHSPFPSRIEERNLHTRPPVLRRHLSVESYIPSQKLGHWNHAADFNPTQSMDNIYNSDPTAPSMSLQSASSTLMHGKVMYTLPSPHHTAYRCLPSISIESGLAVEGRDINQVLLTDDHFSDINLRSIRRLKNIIYITGRLLKSFQIEFNWYQLASWVNITEQWPYRVTWIVLYCEANESKLSDFAELKLVYDRVKPLLPSSKDEEPLLEFDHDEKKFEMFLTSHCSNLQVLHLKIFMPFTIHLDPHLRKVIQEEQSNLITMQLGDVDLIKKYPATTYSPIPSFPHSYLESASPNTIQQYFKPSLPGQLLNKWLSELYPEEVIELVCHLDGLRSLQAEQYAANLMEHNINGRVLLNCNLEELKQLIGMNFGDWELFRVATLALRNHELNHKYPSNIH